MNRPMDHFYRPLVRRDDPERIIKLDGETFAVFKGNVYIHNIERRGDGKYYISGFSGMEGFKSKKEAANSAFRCAIVKNQFLVKD